MQAFRGNIGNNPQDRQIAQPSGNKWRQNVLYIEQVVGQMQGLQQDIDKQFKEAEDGRVRAMREAADGMNDQYQQLEGKLDNFVNEFREAIKKSKESQKEKLTQKIQAVNERAQKFKTDQLQKVQSIMRQIQ